MALFSDGTTKQPLMDASMSATMRRRMNELWGVGFLVFAVAIGLALWSYNVGDPSRLSATAAPALNLLGEPGSYMADEMIRYAGLASWSIVAFFGVWGLRFILHIGEERIWARLLAVLPAFMVAPVFASTHAIYDSWQLAGTGLGGSLGDTGARMMLDVIPMPDAQGIVLVTMISALLLIFFGGLALGFTFKEVRWLWTWLALSLARAVRSVASKLSLASTAAVSAAREKVREARAKPRSTTLDPAEPTGSWRFTAKDDGEGLVKREEVLASGWRARLRPRSTRHP